MLVNLMSAFNTMTLDLTAWNDAPTAADNTVKNTATTQERRTYTFSATDFSYSDTEGDALSQVKITTLEGSGNLQLNGVDVTLDQLISKADIDAGMLTFIAVGDANGTEYDCFGFQVHDGTELSPSAYMMTLDVTADREHR